MRISDCSSDVCSSDLPREYRPDGRSRGHTTGTGPGPGAGPSRAARRQRRVRPAGAQVPAPDRGADRALHLRLDRKSTRLNSITNAQLVCRLLLEKKNRITTHNNYDLYSIDISQN